MTLSCDDLIPIVIRFSKVYNILLKKSACNEEKKGNFISLSNRAVVTYSVKELSGPPSLCRNISLFLYYMFSE